MSASVGLVFPGQGSQSVGMGKAFYDSFPHIRSVYEEATGILGYDVAKLCFEGPAEDLNLTENTQPALLTASIAALRLVEPLGIQLLAVAGHSLGEYSALVAGGGVNFQSALSLVQKRGKYMAEAVLPGTGKVVALLGLSPEVVQEVCREASTDGIAAPANYNSPGQVVIAGDKGAVERAVEIAKAKGCRKAIPLPVSVPVHTPLMQPAADQLAQNLKDVEWKDLQVPLVNNVDAQAIEKASDIQDSLVRQLPSPVQWEESVKKMYTMGIRTFIEVGPGSVLTGLIKRCIPEVNLYNVQDPKSFEVTAKGVIG